MEKTQTKQKRILPFPVCSGPADRGTEPDQYSGQLCGGRYGRLCGTGCFISGVSCQTGDVRSVAGVCRNLFGIDDAGSAVLGKERSGYHLQVRCLEALLFYCPSR